MMMLLFIFFCFITILPLTIFLHELGHFFIAMFCQSKNINVTLGIGKIVYVMKKKNTTFVFRLIPIKATTSYELAENQRKKRIWISLGGPLLNGIVAFFLLLPGLGAGSHAITIWFQWLAIYNLWMCFANIIPYKYKHYYSDGWAIVTLIHK